jgi:hypothetical protein
MSNNNKNNKNGHTQSDVQVCSENKGSYKYSKEPVKRRWRRRRRKRQEWLSLQCKWAL